ncbi:hypothetical protein MNBD_ALPHA02-1326 [hydrothermal vent metagenome]|uniref:Uncharacterized protein n=1 Tax=hydrothermal vent metagenome TaxID=652676 RepID=A0A3B0S4F3_9ZZZZ
MTEKIDKKEGFFCRVGRLLETMEKTEMNYV